MGLQTKGNGTILQPVFPPDIVFYNGPFSCCQVPGRLLLARTICRGTGSMYTLSLSSIAVHLSHWPSSSPEYSRLGSHYLHMAVSLSFSYPLTFHFLSGDFVAHSNQSRPSVIPCHITLSLTIALVAIRYFYIYLFILYIAPKYMLHKNWAYFLTC